MEDLILDHGDDGRPLIPRFLVEELIKEVGRGEAIRILASEVPVWTSALRAAKAALRARLLSQEGLDPFPPTTRGGS